MSDTGDPLRGARPLGDMPPQRLADGTLVTKAWAVALVDAAPLDALPAIALAELAREGPRLCAAALGALGSDAQLERLAEDRDLAALAGRAGAFAGASDAAGTVAAVARLRRAIWDALAPERARFDAAAIAGLSERLARVADVLTQAALGAGFVRTQDVLDGEITVRAAAAASADGGGERVGAARDDEPARAAGDWRVVAERLAEADAAPFALLAFELDGAERLTLVAPDALGEALARIECAVGDAAPAATVAREDGERVWAVVPDTDRDDAIALARRVASEAQRVAQAGAPLTTSIGVAAFPRDGGELATLVERVHEGVFAARAAGEPVA